MNELLRYVWPAADLGEALDQLARHSGLAAQEAQTVPPPADLATNAAALDRWVGHTAAHLGFEAESAETPYLDVETALARMAPALLRLDLGGAPVFLAVRSAGRRHVVVLGPDHRLHRVPIAVVRQALCRRMEAPVQEEVDRLFEEAGLKASGKAQQALLDARIGNRPVGGFWLLQLPPSAPFRQQLRHAGLWGRIVGLVAAHAVQYVFWLLSWWLIGLAALQGRLDTGWLWAWALLLLTLVPLRLMVTWWQGLVSLHAGALLKRRLLYGALRLKLGEVRQQGVGQLLGRVLESSQVEALALTGGVQGFVSVVELVLATAVLALGAGGWGHALVLLLWTAVAAGLGWHYYRRRNTWTDTRMGLTHTLVERMVGHRTRLAQQDPARRHTGEDQEMQYYLDHSAGMDQSAALLATLVPRGWLPVGFLGLVPAFVSGASPAGLAVSLGGLLLAYGALSRFAGGLASLVGAAIAWQQVEGLYHAANRVEGFEPPRQAALTVRHGTPQFGETVLEGHDLGFRYEARGEPILDHADVIIRAGDRVLLEGPSGSGKSTLAGLMTGLRKPQHGLLMLQGLDRHTLGADAWRDRVTSAPQFHENHVLTGTFAFNLLMGRQWPPHQEDLEEAETLCRRLGLGPLLDRMPAGLQQMVGETGWQLSHGERSRLFLARALLQQADLVVLDESFGALDPENMGLAMRTTLDLAPTLVAIAHP